MDIIQLAITTFGVLCLIVSINFFEKNDKKRGCISGMACLRHFKTHLTYNNVNSSFNNYMEDEKIKIT